jgi:hypothetical protein
MDEKLKQKVTQILRLSTENLDHQQIIELLTTIRDAGKPLFEVAAEQRRERAVISYISGDLLSFPAVANQCRIDIFVNIDFPIFNFN